jgi:hypothetical protein
MQNGNGVANTATQLMSTLASLATANFDRAKAMADRVERPEVRIGAYLAIAQQTITPMERRMPSGWNGAGVRRTMTMTSISVISR